MGARFFGLAVAAAAVVVLAVGPGACVVVPIFSAGFLRVGSFLFLFLRFLLSLVTDGVWGFELYF